MKKFSKLIACMLILAMCVMALVGCTRQGEAEQPAQQEQAQGNGADSAEFGKIPQSITLLTGASGGSWVTIGASITDAYSKAGAKASCEPGGGLQNLVPVAKGEVESGFIMTIAPSIAAQGAAPFTEKIEGVAAICKLFSNPIHVVVSPDINSLEDLKGKGFATSNVGSGTQLCFSDLLMSCGMSEDDLKIERGGLSEGVQLMQDNHVVGVTAAATVPSGTFVELAHSKDVKLLSFGSEVLAAMQKRNPGYIHDVIPANTYTGQTEDIETIGSDCLLIVSDQMPDEEAYWMAKTFAENLDTISKSHASMNNLTIEELAQVSGVKMHPGAQRYWDEVLSK